jgi:hypothetical protein
MEARPEEKKLTSLDWKPEPAEQREVPAEDTMIMPVREPRKWHKDRKLAMEHRCQKKEQTQCQYGSRGKLAVAHRGTSHRATVTRLKRDILRNTNQKKCGPQKRLGFPRKGTTHRARVARCKGIARKNWVRDSVLRGTVTGQMSAATKMQ